MSWRSKKKELTPEEAIALAKEELHRYWHGSEPLLAGAKGRDGAVRAYPLDRSFSEKTWLLVFLDPTAFSSENIVLFVNEWVRRYRNLNFGCLLISRPVYPFLHEPKTTEKWLRQRHLHQIPFVFDVEGALAQSFGVSSYPKVVLLSQNMPACEQTGEQLSAFEEQMQKFFRVSDPGLALRPIFEPNGHVFFKDTLAIELGRNRGAYFPKPGFTQPKEGFGSGNFSAPRPPRLKTGDIYLRGVWIQDAHRIVTSDPKAEFTIVSPSPRFGVVAQSAAQDFEPVKIFIEAGGLPAAENFWESGLHQDDEGGVFIQVDRGGLYPLLRKLPMENREITFRFPLAKYKPVALYGLRLGE